MNGIKHFSFDLWFTLIKSNPVFKKERALYFYKNYNTLHKSIDEVEQVFRTVDLMCNAINEKTGKNIDSEEMYLMVIYTLNNSLETYSNINTDWLYKQMEDLLFEHSPTIFNAETVPVLAKIKAQDNTTLSILSNTAFIKGCTLRTVIANLNIAQYFDFQIYSDEVNKSKPNVEIFKLLLNGVNNLRINNPITLNEIVHIGDNPIADIEGAAAIGINAFRINTNDKLITHLF